jgi:hypothetical protein
MNSEGKMTWGNRIIRWLLLYGVVSSALPLIIETITRILRETSLQFLMWPSIPLGGAGWCIMTINDIVNLDQAQYLSATSIYGKIIVFLSCLILIEGALIMGFLARPDGLVKQTHVFSIINLVIIGFVIAASLFVQCFMVINAKKLNEGT